jgi:hypothetical protein
MKKTRPAPDRILAKGRRARAQEPLEVRLSVRLRFGDKPRETLTFMDDRRVPMVDSVLKNRDRIMQGLTALLLRASLAQPKIARELLPILSRVGGAMRRRGRTGGMDPQ